MVEGGGEVDATGVVRRVSREFFCFSVLSRLNRSCIDQLAVLAAAIWVGSLMNMLA